MNKRICVFGDSVVRGHCDYELGGWVQQLKNFFAKNDLHSVYELGISGDTTIDLLNRCEHEIRVREATVVIFAIGINDSAIDHGEEFVSISAFEQNIEKLIRIGQSFSCDMIFIGLTKATEKKTKPVRWNRSLHYTNANIIKYDDVIQKITTKHDILFVSLRDNIVDDDLEDGLHPNTVGHAKIYQKIKKIIMDRYDEKI